MLTRRIVSFLCSFSFFALFPFSVDDLSWLCIGRSFRLLSLLRRRSFSSLLFPSPRKLLSFAAFFLLYMPVAFSVSSLSRTAVALFLSTLPFGPSSPFSSFRISSLIVDLYLLPQINSSMLSLLLLIVTCIIIVFNSSVLSLLLLIVTCIIIVFNSSVLSLLLLIVTCIIIVFNSAVLSMLLLIVTCFFSCLPSTHCNYNGYMCCYNGYMCGYNEYVCNINT
jgi:hypothetical protein